MKNDSLVKRQLYKVAALLIPDSLFVRLKFRKAMGRWPDLKNPRTFNEKLNWLKLHDHNPLYTRMVDKYEAKKYVAGIIGEEYIIPTYGVWDKSEDIDFDSLPDKFVMKATHDSGRVIICHDKSSLDIDWARAEMKNSLQRDFYAVTREWPYKNVKPRIIAEKLLENPVGENKSISLKSINDYKFFCFNGKVEFMKVDFDRSTNHRANYYDRYFNFLEFGEEAFPFMPDKPLNKPVTMHTMTRLAEKISQGKSFVRVDFYENNSKVYFGEMTFYPASASGRFIPESADLELGKLLKLPE